MHSIEVSSSFKWMTIKATAAIVVFVIVYLLLLAAAVALTAFCIFGGIAIIMLKPSAITILFGLGFASVGVFVLFFLFKFLFKKHTTDTSQLIEITEQDEPKLFAMIHDIVKQVETDFPKKVFLSADVNAAVFYNSTFWSMFFPIRKNLMIGMGLINSVTEQELKAVLSHEFGHFSQKSMKIGSYVYNVNQVIYNMLYDNTSFGAAIDSWANISGYFAIFVMLAVKIIEGIQWILRQVYKLVNLSYMALSREMEFHADEVAAHVTGYQPLCNVLLRLDLAQTAYSSVLTYYDEKIVENLKTDNLYPQQAIVMNKLAEINDITYSHQFLLVTLEQVNKYNKSKLVVKDQWASHPNTEDRIIALTKTGIEKEGSNSPAASLLAKLAHWQESITQKLFENVKYEENLTDLSATEFGSTYCTEIDSNQLPKLYNGYYDVKNILESDVDFAALKEDPALHHTQLFGNEKVELVDILNSLKTDIASIENIINNPDWGIKTFDYDGQKYKLKDAEELIAKLKNESDNLSNTINLNDLGIYSYFNGLAKKAGKEDELYGLYGRLAQYHKEWDDKLKAYTDIQQYLSELQFIATLDEVNIKLSQIANRENELKEKIKAMLSNPDASDIISANMQQLFNKYLHKKWDYIAADTFISENVNMLYQVLNDYYATQVKLYNNAKKAILHFQTGLCADV